MQICEKQLVNDTQTESRQQTSPSLLLLFQWV